MKQKISGEFIERFLIVLEKSSKSYIDKEARDEMLNFFKVFAKETVKLKKTNPSFRYEIVFKEGSIESIKKVKGWKNDAEMARELDLTRAYLSLLKNRKASCTQNVIIRIAVSLGNTHSGWWSHFEIVPVGFYKSSDQVYNQDKYMGRQPYEKYSSNAELRKLDNKYVEIKER